MIKGLVYAFGLVLLSLLAAGSAQAQGPQQLPECPPGLVGADPSQFTNQYQVQCGHCFLPATATLIPPLPTFNPAGTATPTPTLTPSLTSTLSPSPTRLYDPSQDPNIVRDFGDGYYLYHADVYHDSVLRHGYQNPLDTLTPYTVVGLYFDFLDYSSTSVFYYLPSPSTYPSLFANHVQNTLMVKSPTRTCMTAEPYGGAFDWLCEQIIYEVNEGEPAPGLGNIYPSGVRMVPATELFNLTIGYTSASSSGEPTLEAAAYPDVPLSLYFIVRDEFFVPPATVTPLASPTAAFTLEPTNYPSGDYPALIESAGFYTCYDWQDCPPLTHPAQGFVVGSALLNGDGFEPPCANFAALGSVAANANCVLNISSGVSAGFYTLFGFLVDMGLESNFGGIRFTYSSLPSLSITSRIGIARNDGYHELFYADSWLHWGRREYFVIEPEYSVSASARYVWIGLQHVNLLSSGVFPAPLISSIEVYYCNEFMACGWHPIARHDLSPFLSIPTPSPTFGASSTFLPTLTPTRTPTRTATAGGPTLTPTQAGACMVPDYRYPTASPTVTLPSTPTPSQATATPTPHLTQTANSITATAGFDEYATQTSTFVWGDATGTRQSELGTQNSVYLTGTAVVGTGTASVAGTGTSIAGTQIVNLQTPWYAQTATAGAFGTQVNTRPGGVDVMLSGTPDYGGDLAEYSISMDGVLAFGWRPAISQPQCIEMIRPIPGVAEIGLRMDTIYLCIQWLRMPSVLTLFGIDILSPILLLPVVITLTRKLWTFLESA